MLPRLYFIRHGETEWSLSGRHTSRTEIPLTPHGEEQARLLQIRLQPATFNHVLTSPRLRSQRTCELCGLSAAASLEPDLAEWDYGDYEGRLTTEIRQDQPDWNIFFNGCPHGESLAQISARADRLIARLRTLEGDIALFSHGHFGRVLAVRWLGLPLEQGRHFLLGTASLSILGYEHDRADEPVIILWNDRAREVSGPTAQTPPENAHTRKQQAIARWENEGGEVPAVKIIMEHKNDHPSQNKGI